MKEKNILHRYHIGLKTRLFSLIVLIALFGIIGFRYYQKLLLTTESYTFTYNETSSLTYQVCMNDHVRFPEICYNNRNYIASAIDYIEANFRYAFNSSDIFNYTYSYSIRAVGVINERGPDGRLIHDFEEVLYSSEEFVMTDSNQFVIDVTKEIDYAHFMEIVREIQRAYNLSVDSTLTVSLHVNIDGEHEYIDEPIVIDRKISLSLPLSEQTLGISLSYQDINENEILRSTTISRNRNIAYYAIAIICAIMICTLLIKLIRLISKITVTKSLYEKKLSKIAKEFDQIIVETKHVPDMSNARIIEVKSFEELLDAREVINKPILSIRINSQKTFFLISNGDEIYKFILKAADLENDKED